MPKKVLIVEDDGNIAELLHLYLEKEGFETQVAQDGGKGVELFRSFQPDLVLLDIMLPVMDGWSVPVSYTHLGEMEDAFVPWNGSIIE